MVAWALIPVVTLLVANDTYSFPKDLAKKAAPGVSDQVTGNSRPRDRSILEELYRKALMDYVKGLAVKVAKETAFGKGLEDIATVHLKELEADGKKFAHMTTLEVKEKANDCCSFMQSCLPQIR